MNDENNDIKNALDPFEAPAPSEGFFDRIDDAIANEPLPVRNSVHRLSRRRVLLTVGPVGIAAALVVALLITPTGDKTRRELAGPTVPPSSAPVTTPSTIKTWLASDVIAKSQESFANVMSVSATLKYTSNRPHTDTRSSDVRLLSNGSYWQTWNGFPSSYDAVTGSYIDCSYSNGECMKQSGLVDGDPGSRPESNYVTLLQTLRNAQTDTSASLEDTTYNGRNAWKLSAHTTVGQLYTAVVTADADDPVDITLIIDKESAFPVSSKTVQKSLVDEITVSNLKINPMFGPHDLDAGYGKTVMPFNAKPQYSRIQLADISKHAGYAALVPSDIPAGFTLAEVSIGSNKMYEDPSSNTFLQNVVVLTYRRGLESFTVTARSTGKNQKWEDPVEMGSEEATAPSTRPIPLTDGVFAGTTATLVQRPAGNHLWGKNVDLVFTISGNLSDDEMIAVAASLQVQR
jgi:hypothetical protein